MKNNVYNIKNVTMKLLDIYEKLQISDMTSVTVQ